MIVTSLYSERRDIVIRADEIHTSHSLSLCILKASGYCSLYSCEAGVSVEVNFVAIGHGD